jgi:hypothetical protein
MLSTTSSIPVSVREAFAVQDLPARTAAVGEDILKNVVGGCRPRYSKCRFQGQSQPCCKGLKCVSFGPAGYACV